MQIEPSFEGPAKSLVLCSDFLSAAFYQNYFFCNLPSTEAYFCNILSNRSSQLNNLRLVSVRCMDTSHYQENSLGYFLSRIHFLEFIIMTSRLGVK